jgi:hypothetical protein
MRIWEKEAKGIPLEGCEVSVVLVYKGEVIGEWTTHYKGSLWCGEEVKKLDLVLDITDADVFWVERRYKPDREYTDVEVVKWVIPKTLKETLKEAK